MKPTKIIWQIFPANLFILFFAIIAVTWFSCASIESFFLKQAQDSLESRSHLVALRVGELAEVDNFEAMRKYVVKGGRVAGTRITVISKTGDVLADSNERPELMNNHSSRPEVQDAMKGKTGSSLRFSATVQDTLLYVAIPLQIERRTGYATTIIIRSSYSVASVYETIRTIKQKVALSSLGIIIFAILITLFISRNISRPLEELRIWAKRFTEGDFNHSRQELNSSNASREVVSLAKTMNVMGEAINEKIVTINNHRNQLTTVFSSMRESLIAIDAEERIIAINDAAITLFDCQTPLREDSSIHELTRNLELLKNVDYVMKEGHPIETEIELFNEGGGASYLQANIVCLQDSRHDTNGVLIVLNDITHLRHLENVRKDFVANVSHELRTPITVIQGYTETLLDGAVHNPDDAKNFLGIVLRQSNRLSAIIEDLLALSRIEQNIEANNIVFEEEELCCVLGAALQTCQLSASKKDIRLALKCAKDIQLPVNAALIEQAIVNLVVNAVRYSPEGSEIVVETTHHKDSGTVSIAVCDTGCGISADHLPRLFERFYRSDKARSRNVGGTGLGLAIVKHIAQAHGGTVDVASIEGEGTSFTITLPRVTV